MIKLHHGDCLDVLRTLPDCSVDAVVTDPPYGLSFMGKKWDYDVPSVDVWAECLRVLKHGGHLLAFAGTRTQHRMAVRIEDAGFEIRDMIAWVYGSGFPKSLDVSKAIDKNNGEVGRLHKFTEWMRTTGLSAKQINDATDTFMGSHYLTDKSQPAIPTRALWSKLRPLCGFIPAWVDELVDRIEAEREVVGETRKGAQSESTGRYGAWGDGITPTIAATPEAKQWEGWGTALKPALEPITVARKPLIGTVAENVLRHGTGAINVDGCRVGTEDKIDFERKENGITQSGWKDVNRNPYEQHSEGRWPANFIHDGSEEVVGLFPMTGKGNGGEPYNYAGKEYNNKDSSMFNGDKPQAPSNFNDNGSAARFFYCAKASKRDRDEGLETPPQPFVQFQTANGTSGKASSLSEGRNTEYRNNHPTVKPTDLMRYLCKLVTPPDGIVLDPFMGSGSTGKAATLEGFSFIGIEREAEYIAIAEARIKAVATMYDAISVASTK